MFFSSLSGLYNAWGQWFFTLLRDPEETTQLQNKSQHYKRPLGSPHPSFTLHMKKPSPRGWRHSPYIIELVVTGAGLELRSAHPSFFQNSRLPQNVSHSFILTPGEGSHLIAKPMWKILFHYFNYYCLVPSKWHTWK